MLRFSFEDPAPSIHSIENAMNSGSDSQGSDCSVIALMLELPSWRDMFASYLMSFRWLGKECCSIGHLELHSVLWLCSFLGVFGYC